MTNNLDNIRRTTLQRIEQTERNYKLTLAAMAMVEVLFLAAFLILADFSNRSHLLLLISSMAIYTIVGFGLFVLGLHVNRNTLRIISAIEGTSESVI